MRAIGIHRGWMYRIYLYEAFIIVLSRFVKNWYKRNNMSSSLLGMLIGFVVSYTMTLQRVLFTQLPIPFSFPGQLLGIVVACSVVFAIFASFGPTRSVIKLPVVQIMRLVSWMLYHMYTIVCKQSKQCAPFQEFCSVNPRSLPKFIVLKLLALVNRPFFSAYKFRNETSWRSFFLIASNQTEEIKAWTFTVRFTLVFSKSFLNTTQSWSIKP